MMGGAIFCCEYADLGRLNFHQSILDFDVVDQLLNLRVLANDCVPKILHLSAELPNFLATLLNLNILVFDKGV